MGLKYPAVGTRDGISHRSSSRGTAPESQERGATTASVREAAWIELMPSRHFVVAEDRERRCAMCTKPIKAGERYFGSRTVDYAAVVRFHSGCAEEYARNMPRA